MTDMPGGQAGDAPGAGAAPASAPAPASVPAAAPVSAPASALWAPPVEPAASPAGWVTPAWAPPGGVAPVDPGAAAAAVTTRSGSWFAGLDPRGWRTTLVVAALMIGTVFGANLVNAAVPLPEEPVTPDQPVPTIPGTDPEPIDPDQPPPEPGPVSPGDPVEVGFGLVLYPPAGWTVVASEPGSVALQKGGVILLALATTWEGDPASLAETYSESFFSGGEFQSATPKTGSLGNGIPSVVIGWTGIVDGAQYDGVIAAGVLSGTGMVLNAIAPKGQFAGVAGDLDAIGETLQIVPGGEG